MRIDLHTHSIFSDGADTPERMVARAKAIGLDGFALTDHDTTAGWKRAIEAGNRLGVIIVPGKEIALRIGHRKIGEILALFLQEDIKLNQMVDVGEIIDRIKAQGGISAIPHPFNVWMWRKNGLKTIEAARKKNRKVDAIEVMNGRNLKSPNDKCYEYAIKNKYPKIAGSDAHLAKEIGNAYTLCETNDLEEFKKLIKKNKTFVLGNQRTFYSIVGGMITTKSRRFFRI